MQTYNFHVVLQLMDINGMLGKVGNKHAAENDQQRHTIHD